MGQLLDETEHLEVTGVTDPDELVRSHLALVGHIVNQLATRYPRHVDRGELWSAGAFGLVEASRRYDPSSGVPFNRFAAIRIRGAIIDSTRTRDFATRRLRRDLRTIGEATERFEANNGCAPSETELAGLLGMSVDALRERRAQAARTVVLQLDLPVQGADGSDETLADRIAETKGDVLPEEALESSEMTGTVRMAVGHLDEVHRHVVERHFFRGHLLRDIAMDLGCTEARVSQLRSEALNALRAYFGEVYDGVPEVPEDAPGRRRRAAYVAAVASQATWRTRMDAADGQAVLSA